MFHASHNNITDPSTPMDTDGNVVFGAVDNSFDNENYPTPVSGSFSAQSLTYGLGSGYSADSDFVNSLKCGNIYDTPAAEFNPHTCLQPDCMCDGHHTEFASVLHSAEDYNASSADLSHIDSLEPCQDRALVPFQFKDQTPILDFDAIHETGIDPNHAQQQLIPDGDYTYQEAFEPMLQHGLSSAKLNVQLNEKKPRRRRGKTTTEAKHQIKAEDEEYINDEDYEDYDEYENVDPKGKQTYAGRRRKVATKSRKYKAKTRKISHEDENEVLTEEFQGKKSRPQPRRWTESDDDKVAFLREYGNLKWHEVTEFINGRHTPQAVQMRYLRSLKRRNDKITEPELAKLFRLVIEDFKSRFKRISTAMGPSFTPVRIQKIFMTQFGLQALLESDKVWTKQEISKLVDESGGDFDHFCVPIRSDELPILAANHMADKYEKPYAEIVGWYIGCKPEDLIPFEVIEEVPTK